MKAAHARRIEHLPEYQALARRYHLWLKVLTGTLFVALLCGVVLSMRPSRQSLVTPAEKNRDIMLCLDVSGSMSSVDVKLVETFEQLVRRFEGQRVGLDVFNQVGSQVFPVTDDYDMIYEQLGVVKKALQVAEKQADYKYKASKEDYAAVALLEGSRTKSSSHPASNVGLGLAGCIQHLGANPTARSQSVILATDNELSGYPEEAVISTAQAMVMAKKQSIRVYALDPGVFSMSTEKSDPATLDNFRGEHATLKTTALSTGGGYYRLDSADIVPEVVQKISAQEAKLFTGDSQYALSDAPQVGYVMVIILITATAVLAWRLKL